MGDPISAIETLAQQAAQNLKSEELSVSINDEEPSTSDHHLQVNLRRHHLRSLHKVLSDADIVVLVLDARDPLGCRSRLVEEEVLRRADTEGKKLIFVLNKVDLVSKANAKAWLTYLRRTAPTLPFLCSISSVSASSGKQQVSPTAQALLKLLKAFKPTARNVTVGVVGFPNVGKSSLINALARAKACGVGAQPGFTKDLQTVQVEKGIRIVDSPGVIFDEYDGEAEERQKAGVLLRNVVRVEDVTDPVGLVGQILKRTEPETIQRIYNLPAFSDAAEFLTMLSLASGRLGKGGAPDMLRTARQVLLDWNHQKIPYFSIPPKTCPSSIPSTSEVDAVGAEQVGKSRIITSGELGKAFSVRGLFDAADRGAFGNPYDAEEQQDQDEEQHEAAVSGEFDDYAAMQDNEEQLPVSASKRARSESPQPVATALRAPKRQRRKEVPTWDEPVHADALAEQNPMGRRNLKREAKRARRQEARGMGGMRGLAKDEDIGLEGTFMTSVAIS